MSFNNLFEHSSNLQWVLYTNKYKSINYPQKLRTINAQFVGIIYYHHKNKFAYLEKTIY
jgi:hypothetical protein